MDEKKQNQGFKGCFRGINRVNQDVHDEWIRRLESCRVELSRSANKFSDEMRIRMARVKELASRIVLS